MSIDYRQVILWKDGRRIDSFRITGVLVEHALQASFRVGLNALAICHLPSTVTMKIDHRGNREIQAHDADRELAVSVTKAIRKRLLSCGFGCLPNLKNSDETQHDLFLEVVDIPTDQPMKLISGEVRLRRAYSSEGGPAIRAHLRREVVEECQWWQSLRGSGKWSGRLVILAEFPRTGPDFILRGEFCAWDQPPRALFGWPGSRLTLCTVAQASVPQMVSHPLPAAKAKPRREPWGDFKNKLRFRLEQGCRVAPVAALLEKCGADTNHIGRDMNKWKRRCPEGQGFTVARKVAKKGGREEWLATEPLLASIYNAVQ